MGDVGDVTDVADMGDAERMRTGRGRVGIAAVVATAAALALGLTLLAPTDAAAQHDGEVATHVVASGETLSGIAARFGTSVDELRELNGLLPGDTLMAGTRLVVEGAPPPRIAGADVPANHVIERGETLSEIAARYGIAQTAIAQLNRIVDPDLIFAGATLELPGGDGWRCPVAGQVRFINDFGLVKPAGSRYHEGVDLYAGRGTPAVAPVGGEVTQVRGQRGGLQYHLVGDDGHTYIGAHLDAFGEDGRVSAGTVIGYVGSTGNAVGSRPHLHFEIHVGGQRVINPYPALVASCR